MANLKIGDIEGIGPSYGGQLRDAGITHTDGLLEAGATAAGRRDLAERSGISEKKILDWVNMADLFRVSGIGPEYAELLECSGVDTVKELRTRNAENLAAKLAEMNNEKSLTRAVPSAKVVQGWIDQAGELPPKVEY